MTPAPRLHLVTWPEPPSSLPATRGECAGGPRPCPLVSCAHHVLAGRLAALSDDAALALLEELPDTCVLDVADRGGVTLETVGELLDLTRERIRQLEARALAHLRRGHRRPLRRALDDLQEEPDIIDAALSQRRQGDRVRAPAAWDPPPRPLVVVRAPAPEPTPSQCPTAAVPDGDPPAAPPDVLAHWLPAPPPDDPTPPSPEEPPMPRPAPDAPQDPPAPPAKVCRGCGERPPLPPRANARRAHRGLCARCRRRARAAAAHGRAFPRRPTAPRPATCTQCGRWPAAPVTRRTPAGTAAWCQHCRRQESARRRTVPLEVPGPPAPAAGLPPFDAAAVRDVREAYELARTLGMDTLRSLAGRLRALAGEGPRN